MARVDAALADSQRQERDERNADIERQQRADEQIVEALARRTGPDSARHRAE